MATPLVIEYAANAATATKAVTAAVARLGYTLKGVDKENGLVTFETGMSMKSWAGQSMSVHIMEVGEKTSQITMGGKRNAHGAQMQVYDWGEAAGIASKIVEALKPILGEGKVVAGEVSSSGGCFVATAVYGSYDHPSVVGLRRFRDERLGVSYTGRAFIRAYYRFGPALARFVAPRRAWATFFRSALERLVVALSKAERKSL